MQEYSENLYISFKGKGVHYGKDVTMHVIPRNTGGIIFKRTDVVENNEIQALYNNITATTLNSTLSNGNTSVATIEHLMAGLFGVGLKNALILIDGPEVPLMDGGSSDFLFGLEVIKIPTQNTKKLFIKKEIRVENNDSYIIVQPNDCLEVICEIQFREKFIGNQKISFNENKDSFKEIFSHAKTFGHISQVEQMQESGLCLGGDIYSAIIFDDNQILSPSFTYNHDDFIKHKLLDFLGDIHITPYNIKAKFECYKPSHKLNNMLISKIFESTNNYEIL